MADWHRHFVPGGTYFFTVVTANRAPWLANDTARHLLGDAFREVRDRRPFSVDAIVVLPDHLHCIWTLPAEDSDFSGRWKMIKQRVTRRVRLRGEHAGAVWQRHYWEHWIRNEADLRRHLDYIHYNPVKHGLCASPREWAASSFHRYVRAGWYAPDWGGPVVDMDLPE